MKSNYVKYCLIVLWIAVLFTSFNTNARSFGVNWSCIWKFGEYTSQVNQWTFHEVWSVDYLQYQNFNTSNVRFVTSTWNNIVSWNLSLHNLGDYWSCTNYYYWNRHDRHYYTNYNYIKVRKSSTTIDSNREFYVWRDDIKSYRHVTTPWIWYSENWVSFDMWFPYHWSVFFYDSLSWHTIQLIWNKTLYDKVLYVDPIETDQNVWVIDYHNWKARSYHQDTPYNFDTYMLWLWSYNNDDFFLDLSSKFTNSYDVTIWWTYALPPTAIQKWPAVDWWYSTETSNYGRTFTFASNLNYVPPTWLPTLDNTWNAVDQNAVSNYEDCITRINTIKRVASLEYACYNTIDYDCDCPYWNCSCLSTGDYNWLYDYLRNYNWVWSYTWNIWWTSCSKWYNYTIWLYDTSRSWSYASKFLTANSWSVDPNSIQSENYCWSYPSIASEQSRTCRVLNIGCSSDFQFWGVFDSINYYLKPYFLETFWEYQTYFYSWYNYLWWSYQCSSDYYWKSYLFWNYLLLFVFAWVFFSLYYVFKQ